MKLKDLYRWYFIQKSSIGDEYIEDSVYKKHSFICTLLLIDENDMARLWRNKYSNGMYDHYIFDCSFISLVVL
jgi:hypothetical protein